MSSHDNNSIQEKSIKEESGTNSMNLDEDENPEKLMWMIVEKSSNQGIGIIRVTHKWLEENKCEIGYSIGSRWWNKGYMTEVVTELVKYLTKEIGFFTIVAEEVAEDNIGSRRVLKKAGFSQYKSQDGKLYYKYNSKK